MNRNLEQWKVEDEKQGKVIGIIDLDAFECQIYLRLRYPDEWTSIFNSQPVALKLDSSARIISSNYVAMELGIDKTITWRAALQICPELFLLTKEQEFDRPESKHTKKASHDLYQSLLDFRGQLDMKFLVEFAALDKFYLDLTCDVDAYLKVNRRASGTNLAIGSNTQLYGDKQMVQGKQIKHRFIQMNNPGNTKYITERRLIVGASIISQLQSYVYDHTDFLSSSCGIGCNKLMARLALLSRNRPFGISILSDYGLYKLAESIKIDNIPGLKGETGQIVKMQAQKYFRKEEIFMSDLNKLSYSHLLRLLDCGPVIGRNVFRILNGDDVDEVIEKTLGNVLSSRKQILYREPAEKLVIRPALRALANVCEDLVEKVAEDFKANGRRVKKFTATFKSHESSFSTTLSDFKTFFRHELFAHFREYAETVHSEKLRANDFFEVVEIKAFF